VKKSNRQLVVCRSNESPEPVTNVSREEESRLLHLADVALHNDPRAHAFLPAGTRAHRNHQRMMKTLRDAVEHSEFNEAA